MPLPIATPERSCASSLSSSGRQDASPSASSAAAIAYIMNGTSWAREFHVREALAISNAAARSEAGTRAET